MSTPFGTGVGQPPAGQPGKVNFGWIAESFQYFQQAAAVWVVFTLVLVAILGVFFGGSMVLNHPFMGSRMGGLSFGGGFISFAAQAFFLSCGLNMALKQVRGQQISFNDMFSGLSTIVQMIIFVLIAGIASSIGTCLCCIPGLIVGGLLLPAAAMVADGSPAMDAITRSINAMKGDLVTSALLVLVLGLMSVVGAGLAGLGFLVVYPIVLITMVLAYRDIIGFGGTPAGVPGFGQPTPPSGFGQSTPPPSGFGQSTPPPSGFGQSTPPPSGFGQSTPPPSGFGQSTPPPSGFGQSTPPPSGFGQSTPPPSGFGQQQPFGQQQQPQQFGQGVFGNPTDVPPAAHPPQFGQPPAAPEPPDTNGQ